MSRSLLPIFACLVAALALPPTAASAQSNLAATTRFSTSAPAVVERAALDLPASSSSSASTLFDAPAPNSLSTQAAPVASQSGGGAGPFSGLAVGVRVGIAGVGFDVATPLVRQRLNLRGGASFFSYTPSTITTDNLNINGSIKLQNADAMVDYFPFHGRFRLSGGATVYNNTGLTANLSVPTGQSFSVGDTNYYSDPANPIKGTGVFTFGGNKVAPRVSIGTGNMLPKKGRFTFESELGVQFFSQPTVTYTFTGNGCPAANSPESNCAPIPTTNVISEQNKMQNDLTDLKYFPILSIGLSYRIH
jgi:hypothetical protein